MTSLLRRSAKKNQWRMQYMSDLHLERTQYQLAIPRAADTLILAGDIGRFCDFEAYAAFIRRQCDSFDRVLLVAGNHEFYGSSREEGLRAAETLVADPSMDDKLVFLNRTRYAIPGHEEVVVLGCTLQSHIGPDCTRLSNDFRRIGGWTVEKHNAEHRRDLDWLRQSLKEIAQAEPEKRVVIVTHYAPAFERTCHPQHERNAASPCFCSDTLSALRGWEGADQVVYWVFGHTHWNARFECGGTTVVSNQYCNDSRNLGWLQRKMIYRDFDPKAVLQI